MNISLDHNPSLPSLYDPVQYMLEMPSKKFRPMLCKLTANMLGGANENTHKLFTALEVFHNFTLMHDDVMDHAPLRRGRETVHEKWGVSQAILSGDVMLIKAYESLASLSDPQMISLSLSWFNKVAIEVCEGQQLDMDFEGRTQVSAEEYLEMIRLKTAVLIGLSMVFAGISLGKSETELQQMYEIGEKIGLLFQIQDDYLDCFGNPKTFGKQVGGDIIEGKKTIIYIEALALSSEPKRLVKLYQNAGPEKVQEVLKVFKQLGVQEKIEHIMESRYQTLLEQITAMKLFEDKNQLVELINSLHQRSKLSS